MTVSASVSITPTPTETAACLAAYARLPKMLQDKPLLRALLCAIVTPTQALQDAWTQMATLRWLSSATGAQLDIIGRIVGQPRAGMDDDTYRIYLSARIATNRLRGTTNEILKIASLVVDDGDAVFVLKNENVATYTLTITETDIDETLANILISFVLSATSAGVRPIVITQNTDDAHAFTCALSAFASGSISVGATSVTVTSTAGFPNSGSLDVDSGVPSKEETVTYTGKTLTSFTGVPASGAGSFANTHLAGVQLALTGTPGLGWGTTSDATLGGELVSARDHSYA